MHFSEIRGMMLLTIMLTISILVIDRLTHPTTLMTRAIDHAQHDAATARGSDVPVRSATPMPTGTTSGGAASGGGPIATSLGASGYRCPVIRRVTAISGGDGLYRVTCVDRDGAPERSYRLDTRTGIATDDPPTA